MSTTHVTLVAGLHPSSRAVAARRIARRQRCARIPAASLATGHDATSQAIRLIRNGSLRDGVVVELAADASVEAAIGAVEDADEAVVAELVCVIDAATFFDDILDDEYWPIAGSRPRLFVARALRLVQHIEHASALLIVGWHEVETADLSVLLALLSHLSPAARIRLDHTSTDAPAAPFAPLRHQPGWVHLLNDEHHPHMTDIRVSAFRYEQLRPFHPGRLHTLLEQRLGAGAFGAVLRSAGFCRMATRSGVVGSWDQVGQMISLEPLARDASGDPVLALGQDIGFIGIDLDIRSLTAALDDACLTDAEFTAGADDWALLADPFPKWITAVPAED